MTDTKHPSDAVEREEHQPSSAEDSQQPEPAAVDEKLEASPSPEESAPVEGAESREEERPEPIDPSQIDTSGSEAPPAGVFALELDEEMLTPEMLEEAYEATMSRIQEGEVVRGIVLAVGEEGRVSRHRLQI